MDFQNNQFKFKDAPRSAIGPDFNRLIVGTGEIFGSIKQVILKVSSLPECILHGVVCLESKEKAKELVRYLVGHFAAPLYFKYLGLEDSQSLLQEMKIKDDREVLILCLSGLNEIIKSESLFIEDFCKQNDLVVNWASDPNKQKIIHQYVYHRQSYGDILDQYRSFLWPSSENAHQNSLEKEIEALV